MKNINVTKINVLKIIGVYFGSNEEKCKNLNWINKVQNIIRQVLDM